MLRVITKVTENQSNLQDVAIYIVSGIIKSKDIAEKTGLEVSRVYNLKRKLKRRLEKQLSKNKTKTHQEA